MPIPAVAEFVPVGLVEVSDEVGFREPLEEVSVPEEAGDVTEDPVEVAETDPEELAAELLPVELLEKVLEAEEACAIVKKPDWARRALRSLESWTRFTR